MGSERGERVRRVFLEALQVSEGERERLVAEGCGGDEEMAREVRELLAHAQRAGGFLSAPAVELPVGLGRVAGVESDREGEEVGVYRLVGIVGQGAYGTVWRAERQRPFVQTVAIKIMKAGMDSAAVLARFEQERQALAMMDHPNVARVMDGGVTNRGRPYFVMEYVEGEPITEFARGAGMGIKDRLSVFAEVCSAVQHAHTKGIIHRDLKPSNILVALQGGRPVAKVIDFGVAKSVAVERGAGFTAQGMPVGTPEYMSPEQAGGGASAVDARSDVYALGVVLYELLSGRLPIDSKTLRSAAAAEIQRIIREVEPAKPSTRVMEEGGEGETLRKQLRGDLDWIVMRCLEKDPGRRYATPSALAEELGRYLRHEPVAAGPPTAGYRARKFVRRHRVGVGVSGMLVVVVLAGVAGTLRYAQRAAFERDEARKARDESVAIVDFVEEVFSGRGDGRVDVREALAAGARAADRRFERHPYAEAGVRSLLGKIYIVLDDYGRAEAQLERALQIRRASGNGTSLALHDTMLALASLYRHEGKFEASEAMLREVIGQRERMAGKNDWSTVSALVNLGQFEHSRGDSAAAVAVYRDCLQRVAADDGDERVWGIRGRLGSALADVGAFVEAHKLLEGTLEFQRKHFGEVHQETLATMRGLVELMLVEGDFAGAELMFADLIPLSEQVFGKESPTVAACLMAQAQMYQRQGHGTLALDLLRRIVSIHEAAYAPAHVDRLSGEVALGVALGQARLFDEAEALLQRGYQTALGAEHKESRLFARDFATALSMLCVRQGRVEDGEKWEAISKRLERPDGTSERK